ncbi:hypothetical protein [Geminicoccus flavidas]|uniref:hypothetical protein n=1 Tax=Geminicoccus flavidas TaxID=2506407 RepID=UPI00190F2C15|nr:hypothetical protein [Geminicoccus flavidas]
MSDTPFFKTNVRELLNNISPGAAKALLGDIIVGLQEKVAELEQSSGEGGSVTVDTLSGATAVGRSVMKAADGAAARTAIGAGTSSLALGTTASTAKAGNYQPTAANISDASTIGRQILTAADAAAVKTLLGIS